MASLASLADIPSGVSGMRCNIFDFDIAADYHQSELTVVIQAASINTGNSMRDEHLLEEDFFHAEKYQTILFESKEIIDGDTSYLAMGDLTLMNKTSAIDLPFKPIGNGTNADGEAFEAFEGSFVFDRIEYGMEEVSGAGNIVTINFYCELNAKQ